MFIFLFSPNDLPLQFSTLFPLIMQSSLAIEAIVDYSTVQDAIVEIRNLSYATNFVLPNLLYDLPLIQNSFPSEALNTSLQLLLSAQTKSSDIRNQLSSLNSARVLFTSLSQSVETFSDTVTRQESSSSIFHVAASGVYSEVDSNLNQTESLVNSAQDILQDFTVAHQQLLTNSSAALTRLNNTQMVDHLLV